jgi:hypothetical protein
MAKGINITSHLRNVQLNYTKNTEADPASFFYKPIARL